jgi:uncharacterized membrane protein (UPF0127 family)
MILTVIGKSIFTTKSPSLFPGYARTHMLYHSQSLNLYVADTEKKREQGLSGVQKLNDHEGMIFIFSKPDYYAFWMKDMNFSLDFIYLHKDTIVDLKSDISPLSYPETIQPIKPSDKIIEVNSGTIKKIQAKIGDVIQLQ